MNYYIKHLVMDGEGEFAPAIEWITDIEDPKLVCHPVVARVTDLVWESVAFRTFLFGMPSRFQHDGDSTEWNARLNAGDLATHNAPQLRSTSGKG